MIDDIEKQQWSYLTEGGKHVIFSSSYFSAWLLRIDKSDLVRGIQKGNLGSTDVAILGSYLAPYISKPMYLDLPSRLAKKLLQEALACGRIPESRKKDWPSSYRDNKESKQATVIAQFVRDARLWHSDPSQDVNTLFSVEIKPKGGYRCFTPLVHPGRRIKYQVPRFRLMQQLRGSCSKYNPLDLFSGDIDRMEIAIQELFQCPHNNLRVWRGREACVTTGDAVVGVPLLTIMATRVLYEEPCLARLLEMQRLDILDGDGAVLLYEHLIQLCEGQEHVAMELIDSSWSVAHERSTSILPESPIRLAHPSSALMLFGEKVRMFSQELERAWPNVPPNTYLDTQRKEALDLLYRLDRDDSVFLLQNWLLSLCLCDVSVFITFSCRSDCADPWSILPRSCTVERLQEAGVPGLLHIQLPDSHESSAGCVDVQFEYYIHIIDFDRKPASKLMTRHLKEMALDGLKPNK
jgi:inositol-pentakisphosphate 2-kinase